MKDWTKLERNEFEGKTTEEIEKLMKSSIEDYIARLECLNVDELKEEEKLLIEENKKYEDSLKDVIYKFNKVVKFEGTQYSNINVSERIIKILNKIEVKWSETLGLHEMVSFWKTYPLDIPYNYYDSIIRTLQTLTYKGDLEWTSILIVNEFLKQNHINYIKDTIYIHYGAYLHNGIIDALKKFETSESTTES